MEWCVLITRPDLPAANSAWHQQLYGARTVAEAVAIGGGLDIPLLILGVGLVSMNMLSSLSVVARSSPARHSARQRARGIPAQSR
jgi:hypothetical protein